MMNAQLNVGDEIFLDIKRIGINGEGIGYYKKLAIFVDGVLPKENVLVKITKLYRGYATAELVELKTPSKDRVEPFCPYYTKCGGCSLQHVSYEATRDIKRDILMESITRYTKINPRSFEIKPTILMENPNNYEARANIMWAGMMAHNNSCGVGRTQDWASHDIEHELSAMYDCAHGAGLAVVMPAVFTYNMKYDVMRYAKVAERVWGCKMDEACPENTAKAGIEALRNFLCSIGMPKNFEELGAKEEDIEHMAHSACYGNGNTGYVGGFVPLGQKDVEAIYRLML